jgi:FkbM family methyltransferase
MLVSALARFNHASSWHRLVRAGPDRLRATSLDRLVYLWRWKWLASRNLEAEFLRSKLLPAMRVVDAGANLGAYSHLFARCVGPAGRVIAFEPDAVLFDALVANARNNGLTQIQPQRLALGDLSGRGNLQRAQFNSGDNRLSKPAAGGLEGETTITTLDEFLHGQAVDFIKMDIQGWELHALRGMTRTLEENRHVQLYIEFWPHGLTQAGSSPAELLDFLHLHGFQFEARPRSPSLGSAELLRAAARKVSSAGNRSWFVDIYAWRP